MSPRPVGRPTSESVSNLPVIPPKTGVVAQAPKPGYQCPHCLNITVPRIRHSVKNERANTVSKYCICRHCQLDYRVDFNSSGTVVAIKLIA